MASVGALGVAGLAAFILQFFHPFDVTIMDLGTHVAALALDNFLDLTRSVWRTRAYGDFWSHMLVAEGACDISAEPEVSLWDLCALQIIVTEAGGQFTSLEGEARPDGGSAVSTNGHLHAAARSRSPEAAALSPPQTAMAVTRSRRPHGSPFKRTSARWFSRGSRRLIH